MVDFPNQLPSIQGALARQRFFHLPLAGHQGQQGNATQLFMII
jgi:hypothetical protein